jgi:hypothetical protein
MSYHSDISQHSHQAAWVIVDREWQCRECRDQILAGDSCLEIWWTVSRAYYGHICIDCACETLARDGTIKYAFPCVLEAIKDGFVTVHRAYGGKNILTIARS